MKASIPAIIVGLLLVALIHITESAPNSSVDVSDDSSRGASRLFIINNKCWSLFNIFDYIIPYCRELANKQTASGAGGSATDGDKKPAGDGDKPAAGGDKPAGGEDKPAGDGDKPAGDEDKPAGDGDE